MDSLTFFEQIMLFVCTGAISFCCFLLWRNHLLLTTTTRSLDAMAKIIADHSTEIAKIQGSMLSMEILKRIELYLATHPADSVGGLISRAIKTEIEIHEQKAANGRSN